MADTDLLQLIPPIARYRHSPIEDRHNALSHWGQAAHLMVPLEDDGLYDQLVSENPKTGRPDAYPRGSDADRLGQLLDGNRRTLQLLRAGVDCGRIQFPPPDPLGGGFAEHAESLTPLVELARVWLVYARSLIAADRLAAAGSELVALGQMGWMICAGEGLVVHYLIGSAIMAMSFSGIRVLAAERAAADRVLADVTTTVDRWITHAHDMTRCLQVDLCCVALPEIERFSMSTGLEDLVDELIDRHYANAEIFVPENEETPLDNDGRLAWRRERIIDLLAGHPEPFDKTATVRLMGQLVADRIMKLRRTQTARLAGQWSRLQRTLRQHRFRSRIRSWPRQLLAEFPCEYLGPGESAQRRLAELKPIVSTHQWAQMQPPTEAQFRRARRRLRSTPNALGLLIADALLATDIGRHERLRRHRLHRLKVEIAEAPVR